VADQGRRPVTRQTASDTSVQSRLIKERNYRWCADPQSGSWVLLERRFVRRVPSGSLIIRHANSAFAVAFWRVALPMISPTRSGVLIALAHHTGSRGVCRRVAHPAIRSSPTIPTT
jgi:hypothetical protein